MPFCQLPELLLECQLAELLPLEDAICLAKASVATLRSSEDANCFLSSKLLTGVELFRWQQFKGALFQQLQAAMKPQVLLDADCYECSGLSCTEPMPLVFETSGYFFVSFWLCAQWLPFGGGGCPSVGVVDAAKVPRHFPECCEESSGPFRISCNPHNGKIQAAVNIDVPSLGCINARNLPRHVLIDLPEGTNSPSSWSADAKRWQSLEDATADPGACQFEVGMLISHGTLEFFRQRPDGWESSGVVWDQLPAKVLCCAFLFGCVGQAFVSVEEVFVNELPSCIQGKSQTTVCGKMSSWASGQSHDN